MAPRAVCASAVALPVLYPGHGGRQQQQENFWAEVSSLAQCCMVIFSKVFIFSLFIAQSYLKNPFLFPLKATYSYLFPCHLSEILCFQFCSKGSRLAHNQL